MKNARKSWNCQWKQPCLVRSRITSTGKLVANPTTAKSKHACIVEAHETARKRLERTLSKNVTKVTLCTSSSPQAMKIPDAKSGVDKEWKKLETIPAWQLDKVKNKKEVILEAQRDKSKVHCLIDGHLSSQNFGVRAKITKVRRTGRAPRRHCKRRCWGQRSFHRTRLVCVK